MWHEARKHEKKLRVLIVDYRRRAERRREYYEKFKADPAQFMQIHGRSCKIHMDSQITAAAENCMMPWQGDGNNMIDRFDARAHLDRIPDPGDGHHGSSGKEEEDEQLNYERYRILIQNDLAGISEDKFLHQIYAEEQFGTPTPLHPNKAVQDQAKSRPPKAAIGFVYEDSTAPSSSVVSKPNTTQEPEADEDSDEDIDFDLLVNVKDLNVAQQAELNTCGVKYGMAAGDFMKFLNADLEEKEQMRLAKLQEEEKQAMSGRKARRERRAYKDRIIMRKGYISPPSYAARTNSDLPKEAHSSSGSESKSRSPSTEKITFITSFGGNDSDSERKRNADKLFGPVLPPEGLPLAKKWLRRRSISKSPIRRKSRSLSRGRHSRERFESRKRRSRSSSRRSVSRKGGRSGGSSRDRTDRDRSSRSTRSGSHSRSRSHRSRQRSRSRSRQRSRSRSRQKSRHRSHDRRTQKRGRRKSSSSRRSRSSSRSRSPRRNRYSRSASSSSSSDSTTRRKKSPVVKKTTDSQVVASLPDSVLSSSTPKLPSPPVRRYYDRAKAAHKDDNEDSVHSSDSSDGAAYDSRGTVSSNSKSYTSASGLPSKPSVSTASKGTPYSGIKLTPQERLRKRMQSALNRQLKADKEAEKSRIEKQVQQRMEREESLRELSIKYRRREREKRHRTQMQRSDSSDSSSSSSRSRSGSRSPVSRY